MRQRHALEHPLAVWQHGAIQPLRACDDIDVIWGRVPQWCSMHASTPCQLGHPLALWRHKAIQLLHACVVISTGMHALPLAQMSVDTCATSCSSCNWLWSCSMVPYPLPWLNFCKRHTHNVQTLADNMLQATTVPSLLEERAILSRGR